MSELRETEYESVDGEILRHFYAFNMEVDGIQSQWMDQRDDTRRVVMQPMFHFKEDDDPTPKMYWNAKIEIDEQIWLREGRIVEKKF